MSSSVHIDNKAKDILIFGEEPTKRLDCATITVEAIYPISFTQADKGYLLSLHYNGSNCFFLVDATKYNS